MNSNGKFDLTNARLSATSEPRLVVVNHNYGAASDLSENDRDLAKRVRSIQRARMDRNRLFNPDLFGEPAWDILLDLFASSLEQLRVTVSGVCAASGVPATTALRWIANLEEQKLVIRRNDPLDARRIFVMLSDQGLNSMHEYFASRARSRG